MKYINEKIVILPIILVISLILQVSLTLPRVNASINDLKLIISSQKSNYPLGEPVMINVELKNNGSEDVVITGTLDINAQDICFYVKRSGARERRFTPVVIADVIREEKVLKPGKSIYGLAKIFYGSKGWTFKNPGDYRIRAEFFESHDGSKKVVHSQELSITVLSPKDGKEKEQAQLIMGPEQGLFLLWGEGDHLTEGIENLEVLIQKYPDSIHAAYANYSLGMSYSKEFFDYRTKKLRNVQYDKSIMYLERVKGKNIPFYLQRDVYFTLEQSYELTKQPTLAKNTISEFIQRYSDVTALQSDLQKALEIQKQIPIISTPAYPLIGK